MRSPAVRRAFFAMSGCCSIVTPGRLPHDAVIVDVSSNGVPLGACRRHAKYVREYAQFGVFQRSTPPAGAARVSVASMALVSDPWKWMRVYFVNRAGLGRPGPTVRAWYRGLEPSVRDQLLPRRRFVLESRLGLNRANPASQRMLAQEMGISTTRIRKIEDDGLRQLAKLLAPPTFSHTFSLQYRWLHEEDLHRNPIWLLDCLELPPQGIRALLTADIVTSEWLLRASDGALLSLPGFGPASLVRFRTGMARLAGERARHNVATLERTRRGATGA